MRSRGRIAHQNDLHGAYRLNGRRHGGLTSPGSPLQKHQYREQSETRALVQSRFVVLHEDHLPIQRLETFDQRGNGSTSRWVERSCRASTPCRDFLTIIIRVSPSVSTLSAQLRDHITCTAHWEKRRRTPIFCRMTHSPPKDSRYGNATPATASLGFGIVTHVRERRRPSRATALTPTRKPKILVVDA